MLNTSAEQYVPFVALEDGSRFYGHDMYHLLVSRAVDAYRQLDGFSVDSLVQTRIERIYLDMMKLIAIVPVRKMLCCSVLLIIGTGTLTGVSASSLILLSECVRKRLIGIS